MTGEHSPDEQTSARVTATARESQTTTKAVLGGMAAVLAVAAVWADGAGPVALPSDVRQAREARIVAMNDRERAQLKQDFAAYERLSPEEQQRMRNLDRAISADADRDELVAVIKRYDVWLGEFSYPNRNQLKDMPIDKRVAEIARRKVKDYRLPREDVGAVAVWLKQNAEARLREADPQHWEQMPPVARSLRAVGEMINRFERSAKGDAPADDHLAELIDQLSEGSQEQLKTAGDSGEQRRALAHWLRQSDLQRQLQREITREISHEEVEAYIGRLSERDQRRWREDWRQDPDRVRQRIFYERQRDMRGSRGRRGPPPGAGPGRRPGGPGGPERPPRRGGPGGPP